MIRRAAVSFALLAGVAACAGGRDGPGAPGASAPRGGRAPNVFISPAGEPFRAGPDARYPSADWFAGADGDHDGRLTPAEFAADAERAFKRFDTNGDGVIDGFEISAYEETTAPEMLARVGRLTPGEGMDPLVYSGRRRGGSGGGRGGGGARGGGEGGPRPARVRAADTGLVGAEPYAMLAEPEPLRAADADLDGKVSLAEWRARTKRRFALLDTAGAGVLTLETLPTTAVQDVRTRAAGQRKP